MKCMVLYLILVHPNLATFESFTKFLDIDQHWSWRSYRNLSLRTQETSPSDFSRNEGRLYCALVHTSTTLMAKRVGGDGAPGTDRQDFGSHL